MPTLEKKKNHSKEPKRKAGSGEELPVHMSAALVEGVASSSGGGGGGMPGGLSAKQQKLFELRMRMVCTPAALI